ncbi:hypothetical protein ASPVEDRAFT_43947 [Aspergillus versicolor CBS 583.65]|uniref:Uncharacterized protein n=1 Tax=Aspergillus versicolor CBS 583.65 TaxID=1036611 RepID=A0A1L9PSK3_ASPVE|nr:uncharacterized protein ASPVEDRAFT_43947 [Aspergillus versicolor CBS 583.65]OJJ04471.1 hypothetical protein ASPVEDRAFT_43947 [Aspergillus versicolor CBS 583.65]
MGLLALPTEILHEILNFFPICWLDEPRGLHQRKTRHPDTDKLYWLLSLRLVGKRLDNIIINRFISAIGRDETDPPPTECDAEGPPTRSSVVLGKRLLTAIVQECRLKPFKQKCPFELVNTILDGAERAVNFLSREGFDDEDLQKIREDYMDALVSVFAVRLQPDPICAIREGVHEWAPEEVEGRWYVAALLGASYLGRIDDMKCFLSLVDHDGDISKLYSMSFVLAAAALGGHMEAIHFLSSFDYIGYHQQLGTRQNTVMHFAALGGHADVVAFLLENCDYWYMLNDGDESPLLWAVCVGHVDVVRELISKDVPHIGTGLNNHMLTWAVQGGIEDVVVELLKSSRVSARGAEPVSRRSYRRMMSALELAAAHGRGEIFQLLLADPKADIAELEVFHGALVGGDINIVRTILDAVPGTLATYEREYNIPAVIDVAQTNCSEELLRYMLSRMDVDVNHPCRGQDTVLHAAVRSGDMGKFQAVLDHPDLDINQPSHYNNGECFGTVLDIILWDYEIREPNRLPYLKALIARPDMNVNYLGHSYVSTAFGTAALSDSTEVMKLLLERDDLDKVPIDRLGCTPLLSAAESNSPNAVDLLLTLPETLLDIWHKDNEGSTALERSAAAGNVEIVKRLLDPALGATRQIIQEAIDRTEVYMHEGFLDNDRYTRVESAVEMLRERLDAID